VVETFNFEELEKEISESKGAEQSHDPSQQSNGHHLVQFAPWLHKSTAIAAAILEQKYADDRPADSTAVESANNRSDNMTKSSIGDPYSSDKSMIIKESSISAPLVTLEEKVKFCSLTDALTRLNRSAWKSRFQSLQSITVNSLLLIIALFYQSFDFPSVYTITYLYFHSFIRH
jgi:hypothetical protein